MKVMQRLIILLSLLLLAAGCVAFTQRAKLASVTPPIRRLAHPFMIRYGEKLRLEDEGLAVSFKAVREDSRCPARVSCVVRGNAKIIILLQRDGGKAQPVELDTDPSLERTRNTTEDGQYQVELVTLDPLPDLSGKPTPDQRYIATLIVTKGVAAPTATPTATRVPTATPTPTPQATPIRTTDKTLSAALHAPFTLRVGQTAQITDEDFTLTFRSADDTSGCFTEDDCSTMQFSGTLAAQKGDQKQLITIMAGFNADAPFTTDFAGYTIRLSSVKKLSDGSIMATFGVADTLVVQATAQPAPPAQFVDACPLLSKFDAAALLQETVQDQAVANLRFGSASTENEDRQGLCGYVSAAYTEDQQPDLSLPHLTVALHADHAVIAAKLSGSDSGELVQIADIIHAANPKNDSFDSSLLKTMVAAGDGEGLLEALDASAQGSQTLHTEFVKNLQKKALWVWQTYEGGHFAALIAYDGSKFTLVAALLGQAADETAIRAKATMLIQQTQKTAPTTTPISVAPPTSVPNCDTISQADAAAILGEPVRDEPTRGDEICVFDSVAHKSLGTDESLYFAGVGSFQRTKTAEYLSGLAAGLYKENPNGANLPYTKLQSLLKDSLIEDAFHLLPELGQGSPTIQAKLLNNLGKTALWLWAPTDGELVATVLVLDQTDQLVSVFAQVNPARDQADVLVQMTTVARKVVARTQDDRQPEPTATPMTIPTPIATADFEAGCPFLSQADAMAILGEPVTNAWDGPATLCGYGGLAQKFADTGDILALGSTYGVVAGVLSDQATNQLLLQLVETLQQDNPQGDQTLYAKFKTWLAAGRNEDVISHLYQLIDGIPAWTDGGITDLGKYGVWLTKTTVAGDQITMLLAPRTDTGTVFVIAQTKGKRTEQFLPNAIMKVADKLTR